MAKKLLTPYTPLGSYPELPLVAESADHAFEAPSAFADGFKFTNTGREVIEVRNVAVGAKTVTITSVANPTTGRLGTITAYSVGASEGATFGPFDRKGWNQSDGMIYFAGESADIVARILRLPANLFPNS